MESSRSDDAEWFATHVQPCTPVLRAWLRARFPSLEDRDDLVQESVLRLLRVHAVQPVGNARAFLFVTARNLALNHLRHRRRRGTEAVCGADLARVPDLRADTPETVARGEELALLQEALAALPGRCREVFMLRRIQGLSQKAIAARMGLSEKTVENHNTHALRRCVAYFRARLAAAAEEPGAAVATGP